MGQNAGVDVSARVEYAVRAMLTLAQAAVDGSGPLSVEALASEQQLPRKFLETIFGDLRRAGLVVSTRGAGGGYTLSRDAGSIPVGEIFRGVEGPLAEVRGLRPHETKYEGAASHLPTLWVAVRASLREVLDGTSLEQLRSGGLPERVVRLAEQPDAWQNR
jgi:Rrf2 family protein